MSKGYLIQSLLCGVSYLFLQTEGQLQTATLVSVKIRQLVFMIPCNSYDACEKQGSLHDTNPNNALLQGKSLKMTILGPPNG